MSDFDRRESLDRLIQANPARALSAARRWVTDGTSAEAPEAYAALARSLFELGRLDESVTAARHALELVRGGDPEVAGRIGMSAAAIFAEAGDVDGALTELERLPTPDDSGSRGRLLTQRAYVLHHAGRLGEALEQADLAEPLLRRASDDIGWLRLLVDRGLIRLQQGDVDSAELDLSDAGRLAERLDQDLITALVAANLGVLYGRSRRLPEALEAFGVAERFYERAGNPRRMVAVMQIDRAEVLMHAGLAAESVEAAGSAVQFVEPTGNRVVLGDSQLLLARVHLAAHNPIGAGRAAELAAENFRVAGRPDMVTHAETVGVHAALRRIEADVAQEVLQTAAHAVAELTRAGWGQSADDLRLAGVCAGYDVARVDLIGDDLEYLRIGAFSEQRDTALSGWLAEAIARAITGDRESAIDACRSGLDHLDLIVAEAPTLERRSAAMHLGNDLSQMVIDLAVEMGDADTVFAAAEGTRARALHEELFEQRRHRPLTVAGAEQLHRELAARLGERTLVEWVVSRGIVWAVVLDHHGSRLVEVGDVGDIVRARDRVLVWLDVAASEPDGSNARAVRAIARLDELLITPLDLPGEGGVVIVPVGVLHGIPWSGLPSTIGRSMVLTPNARVWLEADRRSVAPIESVGLVVGPEIESSEVEHEAVRRCHRSAAIVAGSGATVATVRSMFSGLDLVHVAAHGTFRSDHPLLSTLLLADGASTMYDSVPDRMRSRLVVLSSCEGGAQGTADGSEVLGLSAVMLARGSAAVLAPLTVVRDLECADFVAEVHDRLARGEPFACAVADVRQHWLVDDNLGRWAVASSFTCFGSGAVTVSSA